METEGQRPELGRADGAPGLGRRLLDRWRGQRAALYDLSRYTGRLQRITAREDQLRRLTDPQLRGRAERLRTSSRRGVPADELLCETFAIVRESASRTLGMRHFPVQVVGGIVLHEGGLAEMQTGEGKTLVAVLPAVLSAIGGTPVHVLTFNDYLARRDAHWMGPVYQFLGVNVAHIEAGMTPVERRHAYEADVTYVTAKEAGFDYLRDGLCYAAGERVHRGLHFAIIDEADSILIDEARIPLVIAGTREHQPHDATRMAAIARRLAPPIHYETDEQKRNVFLTDEGLRIVEGELGCGSLHDPENTQWLTEINLAVHAKELLQRDVDYLVRHGAIELVDEFTGRVVNDRQWPDGLQAALEAKEGLRFGRKGEVLGTITMQHFLGLYEKLAGMTATARPEEVEIAEFYGLDVVVLPPNRPCIRQDLPDRFFTCRRTKDRALVDEIVRAHEDGRPVLVGTASVRESEELARTLRERGLECDILNAKNDDIEAKIVAGAGAPGRVTISTNMAGRGTDIRLGGTDERERDRVVATGGLYVIGTNRHESRRIDRQLRGRAGRQGDPGSSLFFVSLEDDVLARYGVAGLVPARRRRGDEMDDPLVAHRIDWAQRTIEGRNFDVRRTLWNYQSFVEKQRRIVREMRDDLLLGTQPPARWRHARPERHRRLVDACGPERAGMLERLISLRCIDRLWADHLGLIAELREGIHLVRLGAKDPLPEFLREADAAFGALLVRVDEEIVGAFDRLELTDTGLDPRRLDVAGPAATWTYLVDDNPFRESLGLHVGGDLTLSLGAILHFPLYAAAALYRRHVTGRRR